MVFLKACISSSIKNLFPHLPPLPSNDLIGAHLLVLEALDHMVLETRWGGECHPTVKRTDVGGALLSGGKVCPVLLTGAELGATVGTGWERVTFTTARLVNTKCFNTSPHSFLA